ncbi:peptidylprolyl isomerase [Thiomicrorhabdus xiamenensis]|uniref:peptidylprolyl isomerase n=1 Tax=Thiomicrorhabdus xiamenensis TaxID=2739063 RepID=A0A7D4NQY3_9GAMM|nr:peptidylprolyl isomerase [Thiomicrorhabdus xiamenensis]QKI89332.1 peptidylprolyl isomerase [Thiomicrorhabdus xiamenensis]
MFTTKPFIFSLFAVVAFANAAVVSAADIASVNGKTITEQDYELFIQENKQAQVPNIDREQVIAELINRELVFQDAMSKGLDKDPVLLKKLEMIKLNLLISAAIEKAVNTPPITDSELKKLYEDKLANFAQKEYKARHILLNSQTEAEAVIRELDKGADFAELAKTKSVGPTGKNGGDLGWFSPSQMVAEFSTAVTALNKKQYTKSPVQTQFGYHVILLEDSREARAPSFDSVKAKLKQVIRQQRATSYLESLRKKANITVK